jgi:carbamoyl-phosphate synthase large subunit
LVGADPLLGPEMRSTGEVMGIGATPAEALRKAFLAAGISRSKGSTMLLSVADRDKDDAVACAREAVAAGFDVVATAGTAAALASDGVPVTVIDAADALRQIRARAVGVVVNTPTRGFAAGREGFALRRAAFELGIPTLTSLQTARAFLEAFASA